MYVEHQSTCRQASEHVPRRLEREKHNWLWATADDVLSQLKKGASIRTQSKLFWKTPVDGGAVRPPEKQEMRGPSTNREFAQLRCLRLARTRFVRNGTMN
ncbi:hypothetical protein TNCV_2608851 [Trichonephila clavipes]|uniref:Uncharacterized protein n=1 Tax=Trichonephila clavipes TaxID=2585209 RepID=A0A8X6V232_TRICX|nr:hypothetical protein TNCV_2608851 [Trichonephila clavipes]